MLRIYTFTDRETRFIDRASSDISLLSPSLERPIVKDKRRVHGAAKHGTNAICTARRQETASRLRQQERRSLRAMLFCGGESACRLPPWLLLPTATPLLYAVPLIHVWWIDKVI